MDTQVELALKRSECGGKLKFLIKVRGGDFDLVSIPREFTPTVFQDVDRHRAEGAGVDMVCPVAGPGAGLQGLGSPRSLDLRR